MKFEIRLTVNLNLGFNASPFCKMVILIYTLYLGVGRFDLICTNKPGCLGTIKLDKT